MEDGGTAFSTWLPIFCVPLQKPAVEDVYNIWIPRANPALRGLTEDEGSSTSLAWLPRAWLDQLVRRAAAYMAWPQAVAGPNEDNQEWDTSFLARLPRACAFLKSPVMEEAGTDSQGCLPRNCSALGGKPLKREHSFTSPAHPGVISRGRGGPASWSYRSWQCKS